MPHRHMILCYRSLRLLVSLAAIAAIGAGCPGGGTVTCGGETETFEGGALITLDGTASFDPEGRQLRFRWEQVLGTDVGLANADQAIVSFIAPNVDDTLTFRLNVTDTLGFSDTCEVSVLINRVCDLLAHGGADQSVNVHESVQLAGTATCGFPPYTFAWQQVGGPLQELTNANSATATVTGLLEGTAVFRLTVTDSVGTTAVDDVSVQVICNVPTIIVQHPANQTVCPGDAATFTVQATGLGNLTYQWRRGTTNITDVGHYSGATTPTLTVSTADETDVSQDYNVVVTGECGSVTSTNATLTLLEDVTITQQPTDQNPTSGSAIFTVVATGSGTLTYQWQFEGVDLVEGIRFIGVNTPMLTVTDAGSDVAGDYRVVVTGQCGVATSDEASLLAPD